MPNPHLLYVAWGFPPARSGGVYRSLATANEFAKAGWDVTVLTAERDSFERITGVDPSLEEHIDPRVEVVRIPFSWVVRENDISKYTWLRAAYPAIWRKIRGLRDRASFPEPGYGPWRAPLIKAADEINAHHKIDLVVATANPNVAFTVGHHLHSKQGTPHVMDYRDAWSVNTFTGARVHGPESRAAGWEKRLLDSCEEAWFVNDALRRWHQGAYPEDASKMHVLANGWDPQFLPQVDGEARPYTGAFGYLGTVTSAVPLRELLEGWRQARLHGLVDDATFTIAGYLGYFAVPQQDLVEMVAEYASDGVRYVGPVPKAQVADYYDGLDALVFSVGGTEFVTSGKIFEYVALAKPIVSAVEPANDANRVLAGDPLAAVAPSLAPDGVAHAFLEAQQICGSASEADRVAARAHAEQFERSRQFEPRIEALRKVVGR